MTFSKLLKLSAASLVLALAHASSQAATIVGATQIVISSSLNTYLQVAEVQAFDFSLVPLNVAAASNGAVANASNVTSGPYGTAASRAIDGNTQGDYYAAPGIYHSSVEMGESLTITFAGPVDLSSLTIFGRTLCCLPELRDFYNISVTTLTGVQTFNNVDAQTNGSATIVFSPIPEPSEWAMMLCGLLAVGAMVSKRKVVA